MRRSNVNTSHGADFRYRRRPWFFHTRFDEESTEYGESTTDVTRLGVDGMYYKDFANGGTFSVDGAFNPSRYETSTGLEGETEDARVGNLLDFGRWRLSSNVSWNQDAQRGNLDRRDIESDQLLWWEQFTAHLPFNLRAELGYRWQDSENRLPLRDGSTRIYDSQTQDLDFDLIHKLYLSLESTYSFRYGDQTSSGGESASTSHGLNFNYSKEIPARSRIIANLGGSRTDSREQGPGQRRRGRAPGDAGARLVRAGAAEHRPRQRARHPALAAAAERAHRARRGGALHPDAGGRRAGADGLRPAAAVRGARDLRDPRLLSSSTTAATSLTTDTLSHSASVELFDQLLTPYYSYSELRSRTTSGYYGGGGPRLDDIHRGPASSAGASSGSWPSTRTSTGR